MDKRYLVSRILLLDGILLILLAFAQLFSTPLISRWLQRELTQEVLATVSPAFLLNHLIAGILLIPFGISTLYSASGVRAGQSWARGIAMTNALAVLVFPLLIASLVGPRYFGSTPFMIGAILVTFIGVSMFVPLLWLDSQRPHRKDR